ncbi:MAG: SBBP repeat-containing protein, partial [Pirellulales bacterium]|nr:SBBP repeat-containing protein [Pirellulales bacterium]
MKTKCLFVFLLLVLCHVLPTHAQTLEWVRQLGTSTYDWSQDASADGMGNVYIVGWTGTGGNLGGPSAGDADVFLSKYNTSGTLEWIRQLGTSEGDDGWGVSADGMGNVYISGWTIGSLGGPNAGGFEPFLAKYVGNGSLEWIRQISTDFGFNIRVLVSADDLGNVYLTSSTRDSLGGLNAGGWDVFLQKYDAYGSLEWIRQFGTSETEHGHSVSADGLGNVYISGATAGSLGGPNAGDDDAFLCKYDANGTLEWIRQFGTSEWDCGWDVSADGLGNVYISGNTSGSLGGPNAGSDDAFVCKYDAYGTIEWIRQLGTSERERSCNVSADGMGNVYISGITEGSLGGPNAGGSLYRDVFLGKYDAGGTLRWIQQLGTDFNDYCYGVSADGMGNVYISGFTGGNLGGLNAGLQDAFVAKYSDQLSLPADLDDDGDVDGADFLAWQRGESPDPLSSSDLASWQATFGTG